MNSKPTISKGFTLIEIAIVLLVVSILLGYTVALLPVQQELKRYRAVDKETDIIIDAIYAYAQVNGRLPCAVSLAVPNGIADPDNGTQCNTWYGFLPAKTLGIDGRYDASNSLLDPWGNRYRYQVTDDDDDIDSNGDFVITGDMKAVGMLALSPDLQICSQVPTTSQTACEDATETVSVGVPAVVLSLGKDGATTPDPSNIRQLENIDNSITDTVFVKSTISDVDTEEFDDIIKWIAPNTLYTKMIEAGQLP